MRRQTSRQGIIFTSLVIRNSVWLLNLYYRIVYVRSYVRCEFGSVQKQRNYDYGRTDDLHKVTKLYSEFYSFVGSLEIRFQRYTHSTQRCILQLTSFRSLCALRTYFTLTNTVFIWGVTFSLLEKIHVGNKFSVH